MKLSKFTMDDWRHEADKLEESQSGSVYHRIKSDFETYMIYSFSKDDTRWRAILQVAQQKTSDAVEAQDWHAATKAQEFLNYQTTLDECRKMLVDAGWTPPRRNETAID